MYLPRIAENNASYAPLVTIISFNGSSSLPISGE